MSQPIDLESIQKDLIVRLGIEPDHLGVCRVGDFVVTNYLAREGGISTFYLRLPHDNIVCALATVLKSHRDATVV